MAKNRIDYTTITPGGPVDQAAQHDYQWWKLEDEQEQAQSIATVISYIKEHNGSIESQRQISARLYGNNTLMGVNGLSYTKLSNLHGQNKDRISYNVVQSVIDTVTAKISKNKPRPMFLTSGGDYKIQRKAKKLDKFCEGIFYENEAAAKMSNAFRDGCIFGDGVIHVFASHGRCKWERVISSELYVDPVEGFYGHPRQLHRVKNVDRQVLKDIFKDDEKAVKAIDLVNSAKTDTQDQYPTVGDQVTVAESWHLPSGPEAEDGLHCISINDTILFKEEYNKEHFPFAFFKWTKRVYGFWGQGLAEQIQNIQLEMNKLLWVIQRSMHLMGTFKVALENTSKIVKEHLNNDLGPIITYTNTPPQYLVPPIVQPEIYAHFQTLKTSAYEQAGISQLSSTSKKPDGLNSGKALREYNDIETDRFTIVGQAYEKLALDLAKLSIDVAKDLYRGDKNFSVNVPGKSFIKTIKWAEVDLEDDEYIMKLYPVSSLPQEPAGRLETVQEYAQAGFISPRTARKLLDFPDLESIEDLGNAVEERITEMLEKIVDEAEYEAPDQYLDFGVARELALQYYNQGCCNGLEEDRLNMLRTFIDQLDMLQQQSQPPAPQPLAPQGGAVPPANPTPTPVSPLLPNVNQ